MQFDRGLALRETSVEIHFLGVDSRQKLQQFEQLAESPEPQIFVHPVRGRYLSTVKEFQYQLRGGVSGNVVTCVFVEYAPPDPVAMPGFGPATAVSSDAVLVSAERAKEAATQSGLSLPSLDTTVDAAAALAAKWASQIGSARDVVAELDESLARLVVQIEEVKRQGLRAWGVNKHLERLGARLRLLAADTVSDGADLSLHEVSSDVPLISLCARLYNGSVAKQRADEVARINGIRDPGLIRAGTVLRIPT